MFGSFPTPRHMPCPDCGASVASAENDDHVCERERWLDYQVFQQRDEIASFDSELDGYLGSPEGRFELWYAARERTRTHGRHRRST